MDGGGTKSSSSSSSSSSSNSSIVSHVFSLISLKMLSNVIYCKETDSFSNCHSQAASHGNKMAN